jgi:hypothetical protein
LKEKNKIYVDDDGELVKICNICGKLYGLHHYNKCKSKKNGIRGECKYCQSNTRKKYSINNYDSYNEYIRKIKRIYGVSKEDYEDMYSKQDGCCSICGKKESESNRRLHIDHDHKTGKVRELLCSNCNTTLGKVKDRIDILYKCIKYLKKHKEGLQ